jgi:hypothetical protein
VPDVGHVRQEMKSLVERLRDPLTAQDRAAGWNDELRDSWRRHFVELDARLARGEEPEGDQYHLMRWLNNDGLGLGPLAETINGIQRELWELFASAEARSEGITGRASKRFLRELGIRPRRGRG